MRRLQIAVIGIAGVMLCCLAAVAEESLPKEQIEPVTAAAVRSEPRNGTDRLDLDTTAIRGNQELPKVLHIVPWKDPGLGDLVGKPVNSLVDEVLAPIDREVFLRQTRYFEQLYVTPAIDGGR